MTNKKKLKKRERIHFNIFFLFMGLAFIFPILDFSDVDIPKSIPLVFIALVFINTFLLLRIRKINNKNKKRKK